MEIHEASDQFLNNLQSMKHSLKQVPLVQSLVSQKFSFTNLAQIRWTRRYLENFSKLNLSELHGQEDCKVTQHEFQNHVETEVHDQPMSGTRPSPDYLEPDLIQSRVLFSVKLLDICQR